MAKLPNLDHFQLLDAEFVYEPSDDTFLLCDAIQHEEKLLQHSVLDSFDGIPIILEVLWYLLFLIHSYCIGRNLFVSYKDWKWEWMRYYICYNALTEICQNTQHCNGYQP